MAGLPDQFGERLIAFLPNLRRFAISLCRSPDLADDLVQLACERAIANAASFEAGTRFDAWMFRILRNLWIDQLRRDKTAGPKDDIGAYEEKLQGDAGTAPEHRLLLNEVWGAIGNLADDQREVLLLVCVEELSYREAAEILGIPIGTVMSRLARARANIAAATGIDAPVARWNRQDKVKTDDFTDEELMAYADGELDAARTAELAGMLAKRPDLAERVAMFARMRGLAAESVKTRLDEPVPGRLKASVEDMIRQASGTATVIPLPPKKATPRPTPFANWIAPIAASLIALVSGAVGYWIATNQDTPTGYYQIAATADPELTEVLSTLPSGGKSRLAGSGAEIALVSSFYRGDQVLCREFQILHAEIGDHLAVACHSAGKWSVDLALRTSGGSADGYKPASSAETLDAFLNSLGAGPAIEGQAEADALGKVR